MKVSGALTHARLTAEAARIVRKASKLIAHETLRMHDGSFRPNDPALPEDIAAFRRDIEETLKDIA